MPDRSRIFKPGFTLVEILVVLVIIGLASAIVVPQMMVAGEMALQGATRLVIADLLYAQNEAVMQQQSRHVVFDPANNQYWIEDDAGQVLATTWHLGSGGEARVDLSKTKRFGGAQILKADFSGKQRVTFDSLGAPSSGGTVELIFDDHVYVITVAAFTGRVTVEADPGG